MSDEALARPASMTDMFFAFNRLSLMGFGGVLPVAQRELVERRRWLSREEFVEMLAISQVLPGPNIVNLALMLGDRFFGLRGAMVALAGMLLVPTFIVLGLAALYGRFEQIGAVAAALRGMGAVAAGLVISTALKLLVTLKRHPLGLPLALAFAALTFAATALMRWPLVWVIAGLGSFCIAATWQKLAKAMKPEPETQEPGP